MMLVNVDGVWINPDHVRYLEIAGDQATKIHLSDEDWFVSSLPPDEVAAILNGEADDADE